VDKPRVSRDRINRLLRYGWPNSDQPAQDAVFDALKDLLDAWDDLADARRRVAELEKDAERLNVIESKYLCVSWISMSGKWDVLTNEAHPAHRKNYQRKKLRDAIDAYTAAQRQKEGE